MKNTLLPFNDKLYRLCMWISGTGIVAMSVIILWGIFARYVLQSGARWPEPISILLMVCFTFFGAAAAYRASAHVAVTLLTDRLPSAARPVMSGAVHLLMLTLSLFCFWYGLRLCQATWNQSLPDLTWLPVGATYLPVPLGALITAAFVVEVMLYGPQNLRPIVALDRQLEEQGAA